MTITLPIPDHVPNFWDSYPAHIDPDPEAAKEGQRQVDRYTRVFDYLDKRKRRVSERERQTYIPDFLAKNVVALLPHKDELNRLSWLCSTQELGDFARKNWIHTALMNVLRWSDDYPAAYNQIFPYEHADDYRAKICVDTQEPTVTMQLVQSAATLQAKTFALLRFVIPGYVPEGLTLLAGKPKIGKSWWALDAGLAVAGGTHFFGTKADEGDVLYLALEDGERRLKDRITKVLPAFATFPQRFHYATKWPRANEGGLDRIREWIKTAQNPRLIVIDVLARFRVPQTNQLAVYQQDYDAIAALQAIASETNVAIVVVHHLRKGAADSDPFDTISGTLGLSGAADGCLILARDGHGNVTLYLRGRDVEEQETAVQFDRSTCRWKPLGEADDVRRSKERRAILNALEEAKEPMSRTELAAATGKPANTIDQLLWKMTREGEIMKVKRGVYALPRDPTHPNK